MVTRTTSVVSPAIPPVAPKPRKPYEWTFLVCGDRKLMQVAVFTENKSEDLKWWISEESTKAEKKKRGARGGSAGPVAASNGTDLEKAQASNIANALYMHVKEGENEEVYPLSAEDAAKYRAFSEGLDNRRGIHVIRAVRGSKVAGLPNKSKCWLSPRRTTEALKPGDPKPGQNIAAYSLFQRKLETDNLVLICRYVHGKGVWPVIIMASEDGLVMVQVPLITRFHNVSDAIDPAWKQVRTEPALREKFTQFFGTLVTDDVDPVDFEHPEHLYLRNLVMQKRDAGEAKVDSGMFLEGTFDAALQSMIEEAGAPLVVEAPAKPAKKQRAKKGAGGATSKKRKAAKTK